MRGVFGTRGLAGGASPCPWGCALGPGGWSGAPFCPRHCPPAAEEPGTPASTGSPAGGGAASPGPGTPLHIPVPLLRAGACGGVGLGPRVWIRLRRPENPGEDEEYDEYEDEEEDEEDEEWLGLPWGHGDLEALGGSFCAVPGDSPCPEPPAAALQERLSRLPAPRSAPRSPEEVERIARELLAEEERAKRKAEKKKLKKKKQKDRKKREKLEQEQKTSREAETGTADAGNPRSGCAEERRPDPSPSPGSQDGASSTGEDGGDRELRAEETEEELDLSCSFVCKARQKVRLRPGKEQPARTGDAEPGRRGPATVPDPDPVALDVDAVERSLVLAGRGNAAAQEGRFAVAVQAFSDAVRLNPWEHRLLGNRSYCYERLGCFEEALGDALAALALQPAWAKGLFRKGKALRGLQRYAEAAGAFEEVLRVGGSSAEARAQLEQCRALLASSRGDRSGAGGVPVTPAVPEAAEPPPRGEGVTGSCRHADTGSFETTGSPRSWGSSQELPANHPARGCFPLWVGNVTAGVGEKALRSAFGR
ncbi:tetratricopeptide repeat protein 31 isoform X2 [Cuculus canorus]|uniref:tetratricopeptide repeat protein 31 isoform X2 n=1 Tax=Cuculus canorus TaxID=55661 RepID=UPI0023AB3FCB|nr:tetratricopeptide repeat protein 31 isoform X2 [Cuculus canorus]